MAAGPFDGLYQSAANEKSFFMVQQNAGQLLVANYYALKTDGTIAIYYDRFTAKPPELLIWDAYMGPLKGDTATVTGLVINMMCDATFDISFDATTLTAKLVKIVQTTVGKTQGTPCAQLIPVGTSTSAKRIF
jgi:hypothetical protein